MSSEQISCDHCHNSFPNSRTNCPHCARPQLFPNVSNATSPKEKKKLNDQFILKKDQCAAEGRLGEFDEFVDAARTSQALFSCPLQKLHREIASGTDVFETYYQLEELRLRATAHKTLDWDK